MEEKSWKKAELSNYFLQKLSGLIKFYQNLPEGSMQAEERQRRIEEYLNQVEFASLEELAQQVGASVSTVRRDLTALEASGVAKRTHGGGRIVNPRTDEFTFATRDTHQLSEKEAIGRACAGLIQPNQSLILDAGTTVYHVARYLGNKVPAIITNSLPVANLFISANQVEVMVTGGVIYPRLGVLVGPLAVKSFSEVHSDIAIMGAGGLTLEGITNSHTLLIDIQHAMIRAAQKVIICLDHTKFGRKSVVPMCDLDVVDTIVTDAEAPADMIAALRERGIEVVVAQG
jgi:DeoR/GlpR family transcriptional regulator of sugar metabolism